MVKKEPSNITLVDVESEGEREKQAKECQLDEKVSAMNELFWGVDSLSITSTALSLARRPQLFCLFLGHAESPRFKSFCLPQILIRVSRGNHGFPSLYPYLIIINTCSIHSSLSWL